MKIKDLTEVKTKGEARQIAIEWQAWQSKRSTSYGDMAAWQAYFIALARKFNLTEEFEENGII